jgi:hypothetical protein
MLVAEHAVMMLVPIWASLLLALWLIPSDPRTAAPVAERAKAGHFATGVAAVQRLVAIRHRQMPD